MKSGIKLLSPKESDDTLAELYSVSPLITVILYVSLLVPSSDVISISISLLPLANSVKLILILLKKRRKIRI